MERSSLLPPSNATQHDTTQHDTTQRTTATKVQRPERSHFHPSSGFALLVAIFFPPVPIDRTCADTCAVAKAITSSPSDDFPETSAERTREQMQLTSPRSNHTLPTKVLFGAQMGT
uniref:Uncharacterized protein n=1 Tax=Craspedostauros australis TaxID=1486917 RepID=A0A7R9WU27_9STRA|mmetsp:Transcript_20797/g.57811  ORF Transcript_20797/g.57811 Transcript_20797/m.57811 type:complete len:116 (+) Transcript_20797:774-1121(+)